MASVSGSDLVGIIQCWTPQSIDVAAKLLGLPMTSGAFLPYLPPILLLCLHSGISLVSVSALLLILFLANRDQMASLFEH